MLRLRALECTVLTIPHTCMYDTYKAIYKPSKLKYPHKRTDERTDERTNERTFVLLELLSQLKNLVYYLNPILVGLVWFRAKTSNKGNQDAGANMIPNDTE